jgi:hypothetical protein
MSATTNPPNQLLDTNALRRIFGMDPKSNGRTVRKRLRGMAEARGMHDFHFFRIGTKVYTTEADLRALLPELYAHEHRGADTLQDVVADVVRDLAHVRKRLAQTEAALIALRTIPDAPRPAYVRHQAPNPAQLDFTAKGTP